MDCGSSQFVYEVAIPSGTIHCPSNAAELFVREMLHVMQQATGLSPLPEQLSKTLNLQQNSLVMLR
jgi:hypothetical protein